MAEAPPPPTGGERVPGLHPGDPDGERAVGGQGLGSRRAGAREAGPGAGLERAAWGALSR